MRQIQGKSVLLQVRGNSSYRGFKLLGFITVAQYSEDPHNSFALRFPLKSSHFVVYYDQRIYCIEVSVLELLAV